MIDDKKLLCAFIYAAYESGYCKIMLSAEEKQERMRLYEVYVQNGDYFPEKEIQGAHKKMMDSVNSTNIRDYIYRGHLDVIKSEIEETTGKSFEEIIKFNQLIRNAALNCAVNFYEVVRLEDHVIIGKNLFSKQEKRLFVLNGLETPHIGDIISGHWDYLLETVTEWEDLEKYTTVAKEHIKNILYN